MLSLETLQKSEPALEPPVAQDVVAETIVVPVPKVVDVAFV
tara:strand:- start:301 stop:423 length:123 start_codon:yes stop_codon:yes gene_type:complete